MSTTGAGHKITGHAKASSTGGDTSATIKGVLSSGSGFAGRVSGSSSGSKTLGLKNECLKSRSPYVRGHANNPVHWQLWSPETLALAKKEDRMVFVSIGYAACHWCHVMEEESFENEDVAKILNENFIPIKVDREERPDVDRIYMNFVQATTGSGGWPLNVFLTPDLEPIFGGTYWPGPNAVTSSRLGFLDVLEKIVQIWKEQKQRCLASAKDTIRQLKEFADEGLKGTSGEPSDGLEIDLLEDAYQYFLKRFDSTFGGFGLAPKFPTPVNLAFLLRLGAFPATVEDVVGDMECKHAQFMAMATLKNMAKGGIHDHIGHGFARYSVTADWSLPHFEKMLYDQAQLLGVYLDAYLATKDEGMLAVVYDIADYMCRDALKHPEGGFYSSEDADSLPSRADTEKREGAFYVWTRKEFDSILGEQDAAIAARYWGVQSDGNVDPENDPHDDFMNQNVLAISACPEQLASQFGMSEQQIKNIITTARQKLLSHRIRERPRPGLDDKIIVAWNGLAIASLARAGAALEDINPERSKELIRDAEQAVDFIRKNLYDERTHELKRVWREGPGETPGFADDYAYLIMGLLNLYEATFEIKYLRWADTLQQKQITLFWDSQSGGFFSTPGTSTDLILRLKDGLDSQEPSTNGISTTNLHRLATIISSPHPSSPSFLTYATKTCDAFSPEILQHPFLFCSLLPAIVASNLGMRSVILAGDPDDPELKKQRSRLRGKLLTNTTIVQVDPKKVKSGDEDVKWLLERNAVLGEVLNRVEKKGKGMVQICEGNRCLDVLDMGDIEAAIEELG
ncbi:hypothetical protein L211DRAFT_821396 [Terfezia boudieri ATCC MYA-4762]|uniref:Spermatogenesis-associated protein 20-like TRX domain-containing protein n=1 Tax=Terfezia boudieri ATCC MYA-4762 TaxID=1051890 RepID=A0A3N4LTT9_9PEZI|nr:hypothetical protein L211DRAFT_821396 [Terfezia boudieri ATCC MYA-4762]